MRLPSIKYIGPAVFLLPVLAAVAALSLIASWQGRRVADGFAGLVLRQAVGRVGTKVNGYLRNAVLVTEYTKALLDDGELDPSAVKGWRPALYRILAANPQANSVTFGTAAGEATWVIRYPGEDGVEYALCAGGPAGEVVERRVGTGGRLGKEVGRYRYDPRDRAWFRGAAAGRRGWTEVYPWKRHNGERIDLGISYALPVKGADGDLIGVLDSDINLRALSRFLDAARPFAGGRAVLVGRDGNLIAASNGIDVVGPGGGRVTASGCGDAVIEAAAAEVGDFGELGGDQRAFRVVGGVRDYQVKVRPLENPWHLDWYVVVAAPEAEVFAGVAELRRRGWIAGAAVALLTLLIGMIGARALVRPVTRLADDVRRIGEGDFGREVSAGGPREFVDLSAELNRMSAALEDRVRMRQSLALAMEIQQELLPSEAPAVVGLDVAGHSTYCDETGGDYYDFIGAAIGKPRRLVVALGDVMGHGVAAALLMATARGLLRSRASASASLGELMTHVNRHLVEDTGGERFMTMVLMDVDAEARSVRLAVAGHDAPIAFHPASGEFSELPATPGLPLGIDAGQEYRESRRDGGRPGEVIVVATDGLWETADAAGRHYGKERLRDVVRKHCAETAEVISAAIRADLEAYRGDSHQGDDVTFVLIKFDAGPEETAT